MSYHPVVRQITDLLLKHNCWFETFEHEPVLTSEEAVKVRTGYSLSQGAKAIRFATVGEVASLTNGVQAGGVPPFGNLFSLEVLADPKLFENEKIIFNAGDRRFSVAMKSKDFKNLVNPKIESFISF
jgi:prolyl-tRNA editing enzyme YbaK/EbsC (Cys-tRNA(Pro) deacylase)